jgi:hypothetical protein
MSECKDRSLAARRARFAYEEVTSWGKVLQDKAPPRARGLPVQVRMQGLQVTVAAMSAKDTAEDRALLDLTARWLLENSPRPPFDPARVPATGSNAARLLGACVKADRAAYLAARSEAIAFLDQVKVYADALWKQGRRPV